MKILLPFAGFFAFAAASCCCCGDLSNFNPDQFGVKEPEIPWDADVLTPDAGAGPSVPGSAMSPIGAFHNVTIIDIAADDAYITDKATIVGKTCVTQEETSFKDKGWHGGSINCGDGSSYYFYKAALVDGGAAPPRPGGRGGGGAPHAGIAHEAVPSGTRVKIVDVAADDAYYADRATIVGKHCVTEEETSLKDGGWHGGSIRCNDGSSYYFYKAQLEVE